MLQLHLLKQGHAELDRRTPQTTRRLLPDGDRVIMYRQNYFAFFSLLEHTELTLSLEGKARRRALAQARRLRQEAPSSRAAAPARRLPEAGAGARRAGCLCLNRSSPLQSFFAMTISENQ